MTAGTADQASREAALSERAQQGLDQPEHAPAQLGPQEAVPRAAQPVAPTAAQQSNEPSMPPSAIANQSAGATMLEAHVMSREVFACLCGVYASMLSINAKH